MSSSFPSPQIEVHEEDVDQSVHLVAVHGEVHVSTAPQLSASLGSAIATGKHAVVVDMSEVSFIDSTGLSVLLNALRRITRRQGVLPLVVNNPTVLRLFEITRLDTTFELLPTREQALASARNT